MAAKKQQAGAEPDDDTIGRLARDLVRAVDHYRLAHAEQSGTGVTELLALGHLYHDGDLSPTQLAHLLDLTTGSVTALVNRLIRAGYVQRLPHPDDRRRLVITLTRQGSVVIRGLFSGLRDAAASALDGASRPQRRLVATFLNGAAENLVAKSRRD
jgi:DNA-binding MarR family transcriptional regulator